MLISHILLVLLISTGSPADYLSCEFDNSRQKTSTAPVIPGVINGILLGQQLRTHFRSKGVLWLGVPWSEAKMRPTPPNTAYLVDGNNICQIHQLSGLAGRVKIETPAQALEFVVDAAMDLVGPGG